jgi:uncharacterized cupredoxin-like copper-binding protein
MPTRTPLLLAAAVALPLVLAACGGDDDGGSAVPADPDLTVTAVSGLKFDAEAYTAPAGPSVMVLDNADPSGQSHDALIFEARDPAAGLDSKKGEKVGGVEKILPSGRQAAADLDLQPGTYLIICTVTGHEQAGMKATLTIG